MKSIMTMLLMAVTWLAGSLAVASDGGISERAALVTMSMQGPGCYVDGFYCVTRKTMGDRQ